MALRLRSAAGMLLVGALAAGLAAASAAPPAGITWWSTTSTTMGRTQTIQGHLNGSESTCGDYSLRTTGATAQTFQGFGACFNELGWDALQSLPAANRAEVLKEFWHPTEGMGLVYNRVPVGGNDYADGWYSHDEMPPGEQDLEMKHFSVARDEKKLIPYIKEAQKLMSLGTARQQLFASAWSPPMWMKQNQNYSGCSNGTCSKANPNGCNSGTEGQPPNALFQDKAVLDAYAHYLSLFVAAYKSHSIPVTAMMVQNEPYSGGCNYPKCEWTGVQMRDFILKHAGPRFSKEHNGSTKMWLGTLNTFDFLECPNTVLSDIATKDMIGGAALQWAGKDMIERVHRTWPELPVIQSENECGDGSNTFEYAICKKARNSNTSRHFMASVVSRVSSVRIDFAGGGSRHLRPYAALHRQRRHRLHLLEPDPERDEQRLVPLGLEAKFHDLGAQRQSRQEPGILRVRALRKVHQARRRP